ncbi:MAG: hypothetical protein L6Q98_20045 [Anaerolineae bacterium]|nr:hypothetical protein [Anaerolineae bacterium]NUQ05845.1 hypothetical protein [Anaerolineae bacterium]
MRTRKIIASSILALVVLVGAGMALAAASGSFVFDYVGDAGDNADGPQFDVTLVGPTDDGSGCDQVIMMMFDSSGTVVDIDPNCIIGTTGSNDGDYGVVFSPVSRPITFSLFDVTGAQMTVLSGMSESDPAYTAYVLANGVCLDEDYEDASANLAGLPTLSPYVVCGGGAVTAAGCSLALPSGSVVGEAPLGAPIYYAPGQVTRMTLNPGTYWVIGMDASGEYYKIVLACQYVWVPVASMQPSYQAPQNGAPLPTRVVS